jgi:hypothetical protein
MFLDILILIKFLLCFIKLYNFYIIDYFNANNYNSLLSDKNLKEGNN